MAEITKSSPGKRGRPSIKIDMTPMVDLAFLLLTFFMLASSFNGPYIMRVERPEESQAPGPPVTSDRVVTLILGEEDKIYWYQGIEEPKLFTSDFSDGGIRKILVEKNMQIKKMVVLIKPSDQSRYKNIVDILDEMAITGVPEFFMMEMTSADKELLKTQRI